MVNLTKDKALAYLLKLKKRNGMGSAKYTAIGALRIFVKKDIITIADLLEEFPELDAVSLISSEAATAAKAATAEKEDDRLLTTKRWIRKPEPP